MYVKGGGGVLSSVKPRNSLLGQCLECPLCSVDNESDKKIYFPADTVLVGTFSGAENQSNVPHNNTNQYDVHSDGGVDDQGPQGGGSDGGRGQDGQGGQVDEHGVDCHRIDSGESG